MNMIAEFHQNLVTLNLTQTFHFFVIVGLIEINFRAHTE